MQLAAICNEQGQSIQLLNAPAIVNTAKESTEELQPQDKNPVLDQPELTPIAEQVSESTELPAATTITVKKSEYQMQPANAESKDPVAIASMINKLMKKTTSPAFRVIEGKPVSGVLQEQEVSTELQIQLS